MNKYDFKWCCEHSRLINNPEKTYRILAANGYKTWNDIVFAGKKELSGIKGIGPKTADILWSMARMEESMCPEKYFKGAVK